MEEAFLVQIDPPGPQDGFGPLETLTSLGRAADNSIQVPDREVSKRHARIRRLETGGYQLEDLGSRNGTFLRGERIERVMLKDGDEFQVGTTTYRFEVDVVDEAVEPVSWTPDATGRHQGPELTVIGSHTAAVAMSQQPSADSMQTMVLKPEAFLPGKSIVDVDQLKRDYDRLRVAYEIVGAIRPDAKVAQLIELIAARTFDMVPAERCVILLLNREKMGLEPRLVMGRDGTVPLDTVQLSQTLLNRVCQDREAVLFGDIAADSDFAEAKSIVASALKSVMLVPIFHEEDLFGAMYVDSSSRVGAFTRKDLEIFTVIANQFGVALHNAHLVSQIKEETRSRALLSRFLSPNLVQDVIAGKVNMAREGERRTVAVMFTDIRGFTAMSETLAASQVTAMLNEYFDAMVSVLFHTGGTLDKFIGDAIMALFGVPKDDPLAPQKAVRCALDMQAALEELNIVRQARGERALEMGIGISFGEVSWGPLGSKDTMDYTVVGDVVNVAARLCSRAAPWEVLVNTPVRDNLPPDFVVSELPPMELKGKSGLVPVFRVEHGSLP